MKGHWSALCRAMGAAAVVVAMLWGAGLGLTGSITFGNPTLAQEQGRVPGRSLGNASDTELWRAVRRGDQFQVSTPGKQAGVLVQSEGDNWRAWRNGPLSLYGAWAMAAIIVVCALFFVVRGRIRIDRGASGRTVERFNGVERFAHWLTAVSFIILAVTGLDILYGRYLFGADPGGSGGEFSTLHATFATLTYYGKLAHSFVAFAFMAGLVLIFVLWVRDNILDRYDVNWVLKGGGVLVKGVHPPAAKFNFGQKVIFWLVVLGGLSLAVSGIALMFPFEFAFFAKTFALANAVGLDLPTELTGIEEMQLSQMWHSIMALFMVVVIIGHIYIGSLGMEGAFWAMGNGQVDENWAREHHSAWTVETLGEAASEGGHEGGDD